MGYITKYGSFWGMLPQTSGRIFWVASAASYTVEGRTYVASDNNDGLSPEKALLTVNQAVTNASASVGDVIVLLPGSHSWSATQTISKAGLKVVGIPGAMPAPGVRMSGGGYYNAAQVTTSGSNAIFTVTAADVEIAWLHLIAVAGQDCIAPSAAGDRLFVHDCTFNMTTASNTATIGVGASFTGTANSIAGVVIRNCYFHVSDNQGPAIRASGTATDWSIESCTFRLVGDTAWDDAVEFTVAGTLGITIRDCDFLQRASGTVITDAIDFTGVTVDGAATVFRSFFAAGSDPLQNSAVADNQVAECYIANNAANVGGTLVLST